MPYMCCCIPCACPAAAVSASAHAIIAYLHHRISPPIVLHPLGKDSSVPPTPMHARAPVVTWQIKATILVFGSARSRSREDWEVAVKEAEAAEAAASGDEKAAATKALNRIRKTEWMGDMTDKVSPRCFLCVACSVTCRNPEYNVYSRCRCKVAKGASSHSLTQWQLAAKVYLHVSEASDRVHTVRWQSCSMSATTMHPGCSI